MSITWNELQDMIVDMGFEEDAITSEDEYGRLIRNAINRSVSIIRATVLTRVEGYLKNVEKWGYESEDDDGNTVWTFPNTKRLPSATAPTEEDMERKIAFPEVLLPLLPLLVAHYVWLDDDVTKATIYWNEYDDLKTQIIDMCNAPKNCVIVGGF